MTPRQTSALLTRAAIVLGLALAAPGTRSAPEEIQVYLDDATAPGHFGLDVHNNLALRASETPSYGGERPPDHVYRLTPELYYGVTPSLELGVYVLTAFDRTGAWQLDGEKIRLKFVAPHDDTHGAFWGLNLEVGRTDLAAAERPWNYELKGIVGERLGRWLLAINLNGDAALSARGGPATLEVDTRLGYTLGHSAQVALEAYDEFGPLSGPGGLHGRSQMLYFVVDEDFKVCDLSAGVGRGLTATSDGWVLKAIVGFHF